MLSRLYATQSSVIRQQINRSSETRLRCCCLPRKLIDSVRTRSSKRRDWYCTISGLSGFFAQQSNSFRFYRREPCVSCLFATMALFVLAAIFAVFSVNIQSECLPLILYAGIVRIPCIYWILHNFHSSKRFCQKNSFIMMIVICSGPHCVGRINKNRKVKQCIAVAVSFWSGNSPECNPTSFKRFYQFLLRF